MVGEEEARLAREVGDVNEEGIPLVSVIADGAWCKRSYGKSYDASSGVGCIVGARTGKLLFIGVRNKFCSVCARAENLNVVKKEHVCFQNWNTTSTSMESDIIVEGFKRSLELHNIIYHQLIGDGDSSVMKKLDETKPYGHQVVTKIECTNHLLRNYCNKLREICKKRFSTAGKLVPVVLRNKLKNAIMRLRCSVAKAIKYRKAETGMHHNVKVSNLNKDLLNGPNHVFGDHSNCDIYFCKGAKENETNIVPNMIECGLYDDLKSCLYRLVHNASSLLLNMTNNHAELYNSVLCKFIGGKRINFSQRGSYEMRCYAAAISYNAKGNYYGVMHEAIANKKVQSFTEKYVNQIKRRTVNSLGRIAGKKAKRRKVEGPDADYGGEVESTVPDPQTLDMPEEEFEEEKQLFLNKFKKTDEEILEIERNTREQSAAPLWKKLRAVRITASNFGRVCKLKKNTSCEGTVKSLLYSSFTGSKSTKYGQENEIRAREEFAEHNSNLNVQQCGLFIGKDHLFYLGASPDGIIPKENALLEIKCPYASRDLTVEEAIEQKKNKSC